MPTCDSCRGIATPTSVAWLRVSLTFLVPIAFAVTVPAQALPSRLTPDMLAAATGFAAALLVGTRWFWQIGARRCPGASA